MPPCCFVCVGRVRDLAGGCGYLQGDAIGNSAGLRLSRDGALRCVLTDDGGGVESLHPWTAKRKVVPVLCGGAKWVAAAGLAPFRAAAIRRDDRRGAGSTMDSFKTSEILLVKSCISSVLLRLLREAPGLRPGHVPSEPLGDVSELRASDGALNALRRNPPSSTRCKSFQVTRRR